MKKTAARSRSRQASPKHRKAATPAVAKANRAATRRASKGASPASSTTLKRPIQPMPPEIRAALTKQRLLDAYADRPPYQRNDYLGWIARAKLPGTKQKRLDVMLRELRAGKGYMNLAWSPRRARTVGAGKRRP